jgi:predicted dehydrogenase
MRIGVLGTGRVVSYGLIQPAKGTPSIEVAAVASRSPDKAQAFASQHGIGRAHGSYRALLDDASVDAVYVAVPPALHPTWVRAALDAGKHVLCEKPLAPNAQAAEAMVAHARERNRVLQEGMHVRFMKKLQRQRQLVASGDFGRVKHVASCFRLPSVPMAPDDFRLNFLLGGGAGLDIGCYAAMCLLYVAGEGGEVTGARRRLAGPQVDRWMRADIQLASGARGTCECGFRGWYRRRLDLRVECERGRIGWDDKGLVYHHEGTLVKEPIQEEWTYQRQLDAFARRCRGEASYGPTPEESMAVARLVDSMYIAAGLPVRQPLEQA